jgi:hypothetical protein
VFMRRAICTLLIFALFIAFCTCHAIASLSAAARVSSLHLEQEMGRCGALLREN